MAALDPDKLAELTSYYGADFLVELAALYIEDSQRLVVALERGVEVGHREEVTRASHDLKSTSAQVGALRASEAARAVELASLRGESMEDLLELARSFQLLYQQALVEVKALANRA